MSQVHTNRNASPFAVAALALDDELARFKELTDALSRVPLDTRRNVEKAARLTTEARASQQRLGERMQEFVAALNGTRGDNERAAARLDEHEAAVARRSNELGDILSRFAALGTRAGEISVDVKRLTDQPPPTDEAAADGGLLDELQGIDQRMSALIDDAASLGTAARGSGMSDVASEIDSLRQGVLSVKNKMSLMRQRLETEAAERN